MLFTISERSTFMSCGLPHFLGKPELIPCLAAFLSDPAMEPKGRNKFHSITKLLSWHRFNEMPLDPNKIISKYECMYFHISLILTFVLLFKASLVKPKNIPTFELSIQILHCNHSFWSSWRVEVFGVICSNVWTSWPNTTLWPFILIILQCRSVKCLWLLKTQKLRIFRLFDHWYLKV